MDVFFRKLFLECERRSYDVQWNPSISGAPGALYARARQLVRTGFSRAEDHFLFIDGERAPVQNVAQVKQIYKNFSRFVNQRFNVPHLLRLTVPNIAIVLVSAGEFPAGEFPPELVNFARESDLSPLAGGEVGQLVLVEPGKKQVTSLASMSMGRYPRVGALPLIQAAKEIRAVCQPAFE